MQLILASLLITSFRLTQWNPKSSFFTLYLPLFLCLHICFQKFLVIMKMHNPCTYSPYLKAVSAAPETRNSEAIPQNFQCQVNTLKTVLNSQILHLLPLLFPQGVTEDTVVTTYIQGNHKIY